MLRSILLVGAGGFFGSTLRYCITLWCTNNASQIATPIGTLAVNVIGCFLVGALFASTGGFAENRTLQLLLAIGFLGGFTTFSAFGLESMQLMRSGSISQAVLNIALHNILGLGAVWLGLKIAA